MAHILDMVKEVLGTVANALTLRSQRRSCGRLGCGCLLLPLLLLIALCGLLYWAVSGAQAQPYPEPEPLSVFLLIDNSNSMFDKGGVGSDPDLLRLDAARLFITYLGVDDNRVTHACGVIFFGQTAELVAPLTSLNSEQRRAEMFALIQDPPRMRWTDQVTALHLALAERDALRQPGRSAIVLLTDGKPEWPDATAAEHLAYAQDMREISQKLVATDTPLFIILLANAVTDGDQELSQVWRPLWQEMAAATAPGAFYEARQAADLLGIYHDIVVSLTGNQTAGAVIDGEAGAGGLRQTVPVESDLARLTLVVRRSVPDLSVSVLQPDGTPLTMDMPGVRHAGQPGVTLEEIWVVDTPAAGSWTVLVSGAGRVTVWKDFRPAQPAPTATPTMTPIPTVVPTVTPQPTNTPRPTATPTPAPVLHIVGLPPVVLVGQPMTISGIWAPPVTGVEGLTLLADGGANQETVHLLDDGRQGDVKAGDGRLSGQLVLTNPGDYLVTVRANGPGSLTGAVWQGRITVEEAPALTIAAVDGRLRQGNRIRLLAKWHIGEMPVSAVGEQAHAWAEVRLADGQQVTVTLQATGNNTLAGDLQLTHAGPMTVTVYGSWLTPLGQVVPQAASQVMMVDRPFPWAGWLGGLSTVAAGFGFYLVRQRQRRQPVVTGTLRHLGGTGFLGGAPFIELDRLRRQQLTIGAPPADVPLPAETLRCTLRLGARQGGERQILLSGPAELLVNGHPLMGEQPLSDAAIVSLGGTQLRYENLRLRQATTWLEEPAAFQTVWS